MKPNLSLWTKQHYRAFFHGSQAFSFLADVPYDSRGLSKKICIYTMYKITTSIIFFRLPVSAIMDRVLHHMQKIQTGTYG